MSTRKRRDCSGRDQRSSGRFLCCLRMQKLSFRMATRSPGEGFAGVTSKGGGGDASLCPPLGGAEGPRRGLLAPSPSCRRPGLWASRCEMEAQGGQGDTMGVQTGSAGPDAGRGTNSPKPGSINSQQAWGESGFSINSPVQAQQLGPCQSHGPAQIRTTPCRSTQARLPRVPTLWGHTSRDLTSHHTWCPRTQVPLELETVHRQE